jgi:hypothetical protein
LTAFKEQTKDFTKSLYADNSKINEIRFRLLRGVGWQSPTSWTEVEKLLKRDHRIRLASEQLVCDVMSARKARADCDGALSSLNDIEKPIFIRRFESAVVDFVASGISVEEMLEAKVIPSEEARTRLLIGLMDKFEIPISLIFAVPKGELNLACTAKVFPQIEFSLFSLITSESGEWLTRINQTKAGELALQSFPMLGEWISFTVSAKSADRSTAAVTETSPACFLNAAQIRDYACNIWRKQK